MTIPQYAAIVVALLACIADVRTSRIPNLLTFGAAVAALAFHLATGGATGAATSAAGWLLGVALFFPFFALAGLGGGDVKLLGALGAWLGVGDVISVALFTAIAGAAIAIAVAVATGYARQAVRNVWSLLCFWRAFGLKPMDGLTLKHAGTPRLAYAVPMLAGLVVTLWIRQ
jgi:prepilin peptidase CpaA